MSFTLKLNTERNFLSGLMVALIIFSISLMGCGSGSGSGAGSLDGDLSYVVEGDEGEEMVISKTTYDGEEVQFSTVENVTVPAEGDLADGDYEGFVLQASPFGGGSPDVTLKLLSDGEVLGKTSSPDEHGVFTVEVGNLPDLSE